MNKLARRQPGQLTLQNNLEIAIKTIWIMLCIKIQNTSSMLQV